MHSRFHDGLADLPWLTWRGRLLLITLVFIALLTGTVDALAHAVTEGDKGYIQEISGVNLLPFVYLGAKHMMTGYDHILFLFGVIFFLYRMKHIAIYVSLFALGHSTTMVLGVYFNVGINSYVIDAIIGLSVVYKALDNMGAFQRWLGFQPNTKVATLVFGLFHGFGLATKILEYQISPDGLVPNLLAFNVGVELGQLLALGVILIAMGYWRRTSSFLRYAYSANVVMMSLGFMLVGLQLTGLFVS
ncbi:HupE/UreJ family protein [Ottowia sp. VDI28]|uniref:HupE/UreJ family protein n=1 Tax=Ottowia sp. VDI28 TaxID=3133968 RepID=UPI003C30CD1F